MFLLSPPIAYQILRAVWEGYVADFIYYQIKTSYTFVYLS